MTDPEAAQKPPLSQSSADRRDVAMRAFAVLGMLVSTMLLVDYTLAPVFCGDHATGCDAVKHSIYARPLGVPLPLPGLAYFGGVLALAAFPRRSSRALLAAAGALGVASGLTFLALQAVVLHTFCKLCVVVDCSAISVGLCALSLWRDGAVAPL